MTLVRAVGRTMLSSYFVLSGIRAIRRPEEFVPDAEPLTDRLVPAVKRFAPAEVAGFIPEDTALLVRLNGAVQVAGGLALATGKGAGSAPGCWPCRWSRQRSRGTRSGVPAARTRRSTSASSSSRTSACWAA
ncbi:hypothetical protein GCM10027613_46250 [Microlunatus endophyticus]